MTSYDDLGSRARGGKGLCRCRYRCRETEITNERYCNCESGASAYAKESLYDLRLF